jgi:hypothetical protein
MEIWRRR